MTARLVLLLARFDAFPLRERLAALAAVIAVLLFVSDLVLLAPQLNKRRSLQVRLDAGEQKLRAIDNEIIVSTQHLATAGKLPDNDQLANLNAQIAEAEARLRQLVSRTPNTAEMMAGMLEVQSGVRLTALSASPADLVGGVAPQPSSPLAVLGAALVAPLQAALPAMSGAPPAPASPPETSLALYRTSLDLALSGDYLSVLNYLERLDQRRLKPIWATLRLQVAGYPESALLLSFHVYSVNPGGLQ